MAYTPVFFDGEGVRQPLPVDEPFPGIGVHGEISHLERGEVLKKMAPLRGSDSEIAESGFHNDTGPGNFVPLHGDTEPWLGRSPASHPDQKIRPAFGSEFSVEVGHATCNFFAAGALEAMEIYHHDIMQAADASIP